MVGQHSIFLLTSSFQKGLKGFDTEKAFAAIKKVSLEPGIAHPCGGYARNKDMKSYIELGYVPNEDGPVSNTLEYAFSDWAVAQMAKSLNKTDDYNLFSKRAQNYRTIFDPVTKFMRQKNRDGTWTSDWDSLENNGTWFGSGYVEGTAWQYTFFVPHDMPGIIDLVGKDNFNRRLEEGFEKGYVFIGNQPNMQAPWLFNYSGKPWLTQKYTRNLLETWFDDSPYNGWHGEEDEGQMGAWFVLGAIGLFEMDGGCSENPYYDVGSPIFDKIVIHLDQRYYPGKTFTIVAKGNSKSNIYIQKAILNGKKLNNPILYHNDLINGGILKLKMGNTPNKEWGN